MGDVPREEKGKTGGRRGGQEEKSTGEEKKVLPQEGALFAPLNWQRGPQYGTLMKTELGVVVSL